MRTALNVLFMIIDDLRVDPQIQTPHTKALAARGVEFTRCYCQLSLCSPSRSSVLTGMRPDSTGVYDLITSWRDRLGHAHLSLPRVFREIGYGHVLSIGKVFHHPSKISSVELGDPKAWTSPPQLCDTHPLYPPHSMQKNEFEVDNVFKRGVEKPAVASMRVEDEYFRDGVIAKTAVHTLSKLSKFQNVTSKSDAQGDAGRNYSANWFLAVGFTKPHLPWVVPERYFSMYDRRGLPIAANPKRQLHAPRYALDRGAELLHFANLPADPASLSESDQRHLRHGYYASASFSDAMVGRITQALTDLNLWESTLCVLWSDHGWKLGEHLTWSKFSNAEEDTHVPLIFAAPAKFIPEKLRGRRRNELVELVDLYPTILEFCGLLEFRNTFPHRRGHGLWNSAMNSDRQMPLEGSSLFPLLSGSMKPGRRWKTAAFSQIPRSYRIARGAKQSYTSMGISSTGSRSTMGYSMRTARYRLTVWLPLDDLLVFNRSTHPMTINLPPISLINSRLNETIHQRRWMLKFSNTEARGTVNQVTDLYPGILQDELSKDDSIDAKDDNFATKHSKSKFTFYDAIELYDLEANPGENINVAGYRDYAAVLKSLLQVWRGGWRRQQQAENNHS